MCVTFFMNDKVLQNLFYILLQEVTFDTFDGIQDKREGNKFWVTPAFWNKITEAGKKRVVNFLVTSKTPDTEISLLKIGFNGGEEIR